MANITLKGVTNVFDSQLSDQLEANLASFFQWGFLGVGGFFNVNVPQSGVYGGDESRLRPVSDPNYVDGTIWEGFRKDWVWETGVSYQVSPIRVSGVYIDGEYFPLLSGVTVDYPNGRVIFDDPVDTTKAVTCEYSYRLFQVYTADTDWWRQLQLRSFRVDDSQFMLQGSGAWDILANNRVQLPAVVVEAVPNVASRVGFELGNTVQTVEQDVVFHVLAEDRFYYKWLHDVITNQCHKRLVAYDKNAVLNNDDYPLTYEGSPKESGKMYPDIVDTYGWRKLSIEDASSSDQPRMGSVNYCVVRLRVSVDIP